MLATLSIVGTLPSVDCRRMVNPLDLNAVFAADAESLIVARRQALIAHRSDIRACGNQVEEAVRAYLRRRIPLNFLVTHGHLIDRRRNVSPQLDVIITDRLRISSVFELEDGTHYVPAESAYAVGELKTTFSRRENHLLHFCEKLRAIRQNMDRPEVANTAYEGIKGDTLLVDMVRGSRARVHNRLFAFMLCLDAGDYEYAAARAELDSIEPRDRPGLVGLLSRGVLVAGAWNERGAVSTCRYPGINEAADWPHVLIAPAYPETGTLNGEVLGMVIGDLVDHLNGTILEPVPLTPYLRPTQICSRSKSEGL